MDARLDALQAVRHPALVLALMADVDMHMGELIAQALQDLVGK